MSKVVDLAAAERPAGYRIVNRAPTRAEIYIYGVIGQDFWGDGISAKQFADDLKAISPKVTTIDVRINSEGGDVFAGKAMYTLLRDHKATIIVHIDGLAASAASYLAMAGDEILISEGAFVMIHGAWTVARGNADDFRRTADLLESVNGTILETYVARTRGDRKQIKKWMDDETWMTGPEAVERGFADKMVENLSVAACVRNPILQAKYRHTPSALLPRRAAAAALLSRLKR